MKKRVVICPMCKSTDIRWDISKESYAKGTFFNQRRCVRCGYSGIMFPEVEIEEEEKSSS